MREKYTEELERLATQSEEMADMILHALRQANKALLDVDIDLAQEVIEEDRIIDGKQMEIINKCMTLLAKQNPVGTDLRIVVSTMDLASLYERIGDLARHIAEIARMAYPQSAVPPCAISDIQKIGEADEKLLEKLYDITCSYDVDVAKTFAERDDYINGLEKKLLRLPLENTWDGTSQQIILLTLLARHYERLGDHAVTAAQRIIYIVSGFNPKHFEERDMD